MTKEQVLANVGILQSCLFSFSEYAAKDMPKDLFDYTATKADFAIIDLINFATGMAGEGEDD